MGYRTSMDLTALSLFNSKLHCGEIVVYDSTLRDGEQMPGVAFTLEQKLTIAKMLDEIGVPQIEAGFPAVSESEFRAIKEITSLDLRADILALSRLVKEDIDAAVESGVDMVLLFIATSDLHLKYKLKKTKEDLLEKTAEMVDYCTERGVKASFSCEDSTRTEINFLLQMLRTAEEAGAVRLGLTDTVGCASPEAITDLVTKVVEGVRTPVSLHLHNDFGMALTNAVSGVKAGARAITTTVNGIGERAGNVPLEQFVVSMKFLYGVDMGIDTSRLKELCETVARLTRIPMPKNQPLVGDNAFAHESGIHVAAVLSCPLTYESIPPEAVGNRRYLFMGKHTGITYIRKRLEELNLKATEDEIGKILLMVKAVGEKNGVVSNKEFESIVQQIMG
jgi:isopropylmalate/homocitrate/citramalate synthase